MLDFQVEHKSQLLPMLWGALEFYSKCMVSLMEKPHRFWCQFTLNPLKYKTLSICIKAIANVWNFCRKCNDYHSAIKKRFNPFTLLL